MDFPPNRRLVAFSKKTETSCETGLFATMWRGESNFFLYQPGEYAMNAIAEARLFPERHSLINSKTRFDPEFGVLWGFMNPKPRPTFNPPLLAELRGYVDSIVQPGGLIWHEGTEQAINYAVIASKVPGVFSSG